MKLHIEINTDKCKDQTTAVNVNEAVMKALENTLDTISTEFGVNSRTIFRAGEVLSYSVNVG